MLKIKGTIGRVFLEYIRFAAKLQLLKHRPHIIGITGSAGKTSTRNAVHEVLKDDYICKVTGKANSESGIPLDILGLEMSDYSTRQWAKMFFMVIVKLITNWHKYDVYIVEMGVDSPFPPKNMGYLLRIIKPDTAIFINALPVHSEPFDVLATKTDPLERRDEITRLIANEKGKMVEILKKESLAILNSDDPNVLQFETRTKAKVCLVGKDDADVEIEEIKSSLKGFVGVFKYKNEILELKIKDQIFSEDYGTTFGIAIAAGLSMGVPFKKCIKLLENYKLPAGRMSVIKGIKGSVIIDSSYNASTKPMITALKTMSEVAANRKKIAILGDMREMGKESQHEHELVAEEAVKNADIIYLVGPLMKEFFLPHAITLKFNEKDIKWFDRADKLAQELKDSLNGNEIILVKGSQNTLFLEKVVEEIMLEPEKADELLARRGKYWDKERLKVFN